MGRPRKPNDEKRRQVAVRLGPDDLLRMTSIAQQRDISVGAAIETLALERLQQLEATDRETEELLSDIRRAIAGIERKSAKRWHKDKATWSAVSYMLAGDLIRRRDPDPDDRDEVVTTASEKLKAIKARKTELGKQLRSVGAPVTGSDETPVKLDVEAALAYRRQILKTLKRSERAAIAAIERREDREKAEVLYAEFSELDLAENEAMVDLGRALEPYQEAVRQGERIYAASRAPFSDPDVVDLN